ncbi:MULTISPECIES: hypothetical protein [unclassified Paenibacillus]|uniref:hypothetical protein n=1 Tax=unclassified Paenibacillus TaxID=185978 RepID=UPI0024076BE1|nr:MULTISPECIES: hypothetical protein [unclassified Paenibacillus]MDF9839467.1 hypothetical protein [Paenibacillus sp. PastF-2]MDF9846048.1 hypothetical protein [Paenibacillus sp. PastM-2]MDF9852621.1 hypothetical protein [Paenibacillus sp. PastF-1]MDH6477648.1 hypothetical protein [Paenibacillus sp. PastH-2]MDH6505390.1 hypothetical protein [Paenibacillus sp. PastM-3]
MKHVEELKKKYQVLEERISKFITEHSGVVYVKNSGDIAEGRIFTWAVISSDDKVLQAQLRLDYVTISELARQRLEQIHSRYIADFDRSREIVLSYIRQDSMLLKILSLEAAAEVAKNEMRLQKFLLT